jgi:hypothetical protein
MNSNYGKTNMIKKRGGVLQHCGTPIRMVPRESAVCYLSKEYNRIEIRADILGWSSSILNRMSTTSAFVRRSKK